MYSTYIVIILHPKICFNEDTFVTKSVHCLQKYQLDRISLHDSKKATYEHTKKCAENLMLLGQTDRAVQLLLETDSDNDNYYVDCLRYLRQFNLLIFLSCQREN